MKESGQQEVYVFAHWKGLSQPVPIGTLISNRKKGRAVSYFEYSKDWLNSQEQILLDPDLSWFSGPQFPGKKQNFGLFLDSMPDTWGRTLMKKRAVLQSRHQGKPIQMLADVDFLLGVDDFCRMGAIRLKTNPDGPFLDNNKEFPTPPWVKIRELQYSAELVESNSDTDELKQWLPYLMAPGSSLGGARPKANVLDSDGQLWIAKFPSKNDSLDKAKWEYLAYILATKAGINMAESKIERVSGSHYTFFTKRFDREQNERIHFASAMTMTGNNEEVIRDNQPSYLEIAEFIQFSGADVAKNLRQLWRRIVFNIAISNTDDHLRNHGFILTPKGWVLSPAFDINPSIDKNGLSLNIDQYDNSLDIDLAITVGANFQLEINEMNRIIDEVLSSVANWKKIAKDIGINPLEQEIMESAFRVLK
jgi:serine/threonine-protein kinase HipA